MKTSARASAASLGAVARKAGRCTLCPLCKNAAQTVFGEGPAGAKLMLVGD